MKRLDLQVSTPGLPASVALEESRNNEPLGLSGGVLPGTERFFALWSLSWNSAW